MFASLNVFGEGCGDCVFLGLVVAGAAGLLDEVVVESEIGCHVYSITHYGVWKQLSQYNLSGFDSPRPTHPQSARKGWGTLINHLASKVKDLDRNVRNTPRLLEEVPGFAVGFPARAFAGDAGIEAEAGGTGYDVDGEDVPGVQRDDVSDEDVDIFGGVGDFAFSVSTVDGLNVVAAGAQDFGAFELHAPEAGAGVEDEVVALAVSPGFGGVEAEGSGFEHEGGFGEFSGTLGVAGNELGFCRADPAGVLDWCHDGCLPFGWEKRERRSYWLRLW